MATDTVDTTGRTEIGYVTLTDEETELSVLIGDAIVFDPTGRDLRSECVVGIVHYIDDDGDREGRPAPLVHINGTCPVQMCVVTRAKAVLS